MSADVAIFNLLSTAGPGWPRTPPLENGNAALWRGLQGFFYTAKGKFHRLPRDAVNAAVAAMRLALAAAWRSKPDASPRVLPLTVP
jgi:hypothetical protein